MALFMLVAIGCTGKNKKSSNDIVMALTSEAKTMDPRFATDANGMRLSNLIFQSLVRVGPSLEIIGDAAKSWKYEELKYIFELHPNLTFSDGSPVTDEDIYFTFEQYKSENNPFKSSLSFIEKVEIHNENNVRTVILRVNEFKATAYADLTPVKILPKKAVLKFGEDFSRNLIGSGSFQVEKVTSNEIRLLARKKGTTITPKIERVIFKIIRDESTLFLKTKKGNLDIVQAEMPPQKVSHFRKLSDFKVYEYPGLKMNYLLINLKSKDLSKVSVRKLIASSINRDEIIQYKLANLAIPATSILTPGNPFFHDKLKPITFDENTAREKLNQLGKIHLNLKTSNNPVAVENGKVIANQLSKVGFEVNHQSFEWGTFYDDVKKGNFQLATMRWVGATDPDIYRIALHTKEQPPGRNRGYYSNPLLDKLLERGTSIESLKTRIEHYKKVQEIVMEDLPIIPLWYNKDVSIIKNDLKGYEPPLNGDFTPLLYVYK